MDNEVSGNGNQYDYGFRIYNPRIAKFLSVDPISKKYPMLTPYQFASNTPIQAIDLDGLEAYHFVYAYNHEKSGYDLIIKIKDNNQLKLTLTHHYINEDGSRSKSLTKDLGYDALYVLWYYATFFDERGIHIWGDGDGSDSPGREPIKIYGQIDYSELDKIFSLLKLSLSNKYKKPGPKPFPEKAVDFGDQAKDVISENKKKSTNEKAEEKYEKIVKTKNQYGGYDVVESRETSTGSSTLIYHTNSQGEKMGCGKQKQAYYEQ